MQSRTPYFPTCSWLWMYSTCDLLSVRVLRDDNVNPDQALQKQIELCRRMTGEQRLGIALELHELSCNIAREGIRHQNPSADEGVVERLLHQRLNLVRQ
jgi:hypothetical protein